MKKQIANWGNYPVIESDEAFFTLPEQLQELLSKNTGFIPRGNGRCYGDASLANTTISTLKFNKILFFDKMAGVFECQSGLMLDQILDVIVPAGWFLPVTPGTKFITVGGAVASDVHGKNHHVDGSFSNHVIDMDIVLAAKETVTCSREINRDLFEATCGGMGLTGIISRIKFRLKKIETSFIKQKQIKAANLEELISLFDEYQGYTYSVAWIDCLKTGPHFGRSILILGEHACLKDLNEKQSRNPLEVPGKNKLIFHLTCLPGFSIHSPLKRSIPFFILKISRKRSIV